MSESRIRLSKSFSFPAELVTQTTAILAKRGAGKSYTASVMVEGMIGAHLPVAVVDPVGSWWGLRFAADGKGPGLPVVILGGEHGDLPLESTGGEVIADFVIESRQPVILDLSRFTKGEARRFMKDFAERLYHKNRDALHVVLDEADAFVPQRTDHGAEPLVGAINDLVRRGRARGIGVTLISQRPALINKDVLTQIEVLIALRMTGPQDRDALERWVENNADKSKAKKLLEELAELPIGTAWVWSPGWLDVFQRVEIAKRKTFDSSATPKAGTKRVVPKAPAAIDLEALRGKLSATIERAKAEDPRELRRTIAELKKQLADKPSVAPPATPAFSIERLDQLARIRREVQALDVLVSELYEVLAAARPAPVGKKPEWHPIPIEAHAARLPPAAKSNGAAKHVAGDVELGIGPMAILGATIQHGGCTPEHLTVLLGYKKSSRNTYLQKLSSAGLIEKRDGKIIATQKGRTLARDVEPLPTGEALRVKVLSTLPEGERKILALLIAEYPNAIAGEVIDRLTGYMKSSRNTYLQKLSARQLVTKPQSGVTRASDMLFDGGASS